MVINARGQSAAAERQEVFAFLRILLEDFLPFGVDDFHAHAVLDPASFIDGDAINVEGDEIDVARQEFGIGTNGPEFAIGYAGITQFDAGGLPRGDAKGSDKCK